MESVIYFVKAGTVQISNKSIMKSYVVDGRFIIGYKRQHQERARSISQIIVCYAISAKALSSILNKASIQQLSEQSKYSSYFHTSAQTPSLHEEEAMLHSNPSISKIKQSMGMLKRTNSQLFKKNIHKTQSIQQIEQKSTKRLRLRGHFSNFCNQVFDAYSQKKMKQIGLNMNDQQNLRLYQIKLLKKRMPVMDEIKQKLKKTKEYKMKLCKIRLKEIQNRRPYGQSCMRIVQL